MRVVMAQRNPLVGDIEGNADAVVAAAREARNLLGAELVVFPELVLTGYPPEDLLLRPSLNGRVDDALHLELHRVALEPGAALDEALLHPPLECHRPQVRRRRNVRLEIAIMGRLAHHNLVEFHDAFETAKQVCLRGTAVCVCRISAVYVRCPSADRRRRSL